MIKLVPNSSTGVEGGSISSFQWSTSEQVYPFELGPNGETLYCRRFDFSSFSAPAWFSAAHGYYGNSNFKPYRLFGTLASPNWAGPVSLVTIPNYLVQDNLSIGCYSNDTNANGYVGGGFSSSCTASLYFIYIK